MNNKIILIGILILAMCISGCVNNDYIDNDSTEDISYNTSNTSNIYTINDINKSDISGVNINNVTEISIDDWRLTHVIINPIDDTDIVMGYYYSDIHPNNVNVHVGDVVKWVNEDHGTRFNVMASPPDEGYWDWQILEFRENVSIKFLKVGIYKFYNPYNHMMNGSITVT